MPSPPQAVAAAVSASSIVLSPNFVTGIVTFGLNLVVTLTLLWLQKKSTSRKGKEERQYQSTLFLFQTLVVAELSNYLDKADEIERIFLDALVKCQNAPKPALLRKLMEDAIDLLDVVDRDVQATLLRKTRVFSDDFFGTASNGWDKYYDAATDLCSKLGSSPLNAVSDKKMRDGINCLKDGYFDEFLTLVKSSHPHLKS